MTPINKLSGNICQSCRTLISNKSGRQFLCPECQKKALGLLKYCSGVLNGIPNTKIEDTNTYLIISKLDKFIKDVDYE